MKKNIIPIIILLTLIISSCTTTNAPDLAVWVHGRESTTPAEWDSLFHKMADHGVETALIGGNVIVLERAVKHAAKYGVNVQAWIWALNRGDAKPEWLSINQKGNSLADSMAYVGYYKFMCPIIPEARQFLKDKVLELTKIDGLQAIHLDYIRYVDAILPVGLQPKYGLDQYKVFPEFDYGYHPEMLRKFEEKHGYNPLMGDVEADTLWLQFRLDQVTTLVNEIADLVHANGKQLTAAVFPTPEMATKMVRQQWNHWNLDRAYPMVYHNFYNEDNQWIKAIMKENKAAVDFPVNCGLYLPALQDSTAFASAINSALEGGADGITLFEAGAMKEWHWSFLKTKR